MNTMIKVGNALYNVYDIQSVADVTANPMVVTMNDGTTTFNWPNASGAGYKLLQQYMKVVDVGS